MVEEGRYYADILTQVTSAQEALRAVARALMRNHLSHCATQAAACPRHLVERRPHIAVDLMEVVVGIAPVFVPKTRIADVKDRTALLQAMDEARQNLRHTRAILTRHETRNAGAGGLRRSSRRCIAAPPCLVLRLAPRNLAIYDESSLDDRKRMLRVGVNLDGVMITDDASYKYSVAHGGFNIGAGPMNLSLTGEDVTVKGKPCTSSLPSCTDKLVPFPR
jgi:hypothetical protein